MFHIFIIDDDKYAVEAVCRMFPWEALNVSHIEKIYTSHGLVARILSEKPQIVFIDIELQDASGLDIVQQCREHGSGTLFVIISGHDNFKYAHKAANLGVLYYLLKPIDSESVATITQRLKKSLLQSNYDERFNYLASDKSFAKWLANDLSDNYSYRILIGELSQNECDDIKSLLGQGLVIFHKIGSKRGLFIISEDHFTSGLQMALQDYAAQKQLTLGVSHMFSRLGHISEHFRQASLLSYHYFISQRHDLAFPEATTQTDIRQIINNLLHAFDMQSADDVKRILEELPGLFVSRQYTILQAVLLYNSVVARINLSYTAQGHGIPLSQMNEDDLFVHFQTFRTLCGTLWDYFEESLDAELDLLEDSHELWIKISSYINESYHKKLSAQDICEHFFISQRSFFNVFKNNTQVTFVAYLTRIRIEKAKQLLITTKNTLPEIAEAVGIGDYYYFNKVFKKMTGITPSKYKRQGET